MAEKITTHITKSERYVVDGTEYHSLAEIPEREREKLDAALKLLKDKAEGFSQSTFDNVQSSRVEVKREIRVSSSDDAKNAGDVLRDVLHDFGSASIPADDERTKTAQNIISIPPEQGSEKQRNDRTWYVIVILALLAVIVFLLARQQR